MRPALESWLDERCRKHGPIVARVQAVMMAVSIVDMDDPPAWVRPLDAFALLAFGTGCTADEARAALATIGVLDDEDFQPPPEAS